MHQLHSQVECSGVIQILQSRILDLLEGVEFLIWDFCVKDLLDRVNLKRDFSGFDQINEIQLDLVHGFIELTCNLAHRNNLISFNMLLERLQPNFSENVLFVV